MICGANSGYEIKILSELFPSAKFTAVDISSEALSKIPENVKAIHANMESLPFEDKTFDLYINCRAIHSSDVDMLKAINESIRVTKGDIVISVSNGYKVEDSLINGMYDYDLEKIDIDKPFKIVNQLKDMFKRKGYFIVEYSSEAEIFLIAINHN